MVSSRKILRRKKTLPRVYPDKKVSMETMEKISTKYRKLIKLRHPYWAALRLTNIRKNYWHIADDSLIVLYLMPIGVNFGLISLTNYYRKIRSDLRTAVYRKVRAVGVSRL